MHGTGIKSENCGKSGKNKVRLTGLHKHKVLEPGGMCTPAFNATPVELRCRYTSKLQVCPDKLLYRPVVESFLSSNNLIMWLHEQQMYTV